WIAGKQREEGTNYLFNAADPRATYRARLDEAYLSYRTGDWAFRGGNLKTRWGSTDIVRPGDVVNPRDFVRFDGSATGADLLLPQLTGEAQYGGDDWSVTAILVPFFVEDEAAVFGRDFAAAGPFGPLVGDQFPIFDALEQAVHPSRYDDVQPLFRASRVPEEKPENASAGLRGTVTKWNTDFGLGYFFGWDRTPWLHVDEDVQRLAALAVEDGRVLSDLDLEGFFERNAEAEQAWVRAGQKATEGEQLVYGEYRRQHNVVVDLARYIGPIGVRADAAFAAQRTLFTTDLEPVRRPTLTGALGLSWERIRSEDDAIALSLEGFWMHPFSASSGLTRALIPEDERGPREADLMLVGDGMYGLAGAARATLPWDLQLQTGAIATLSNGDVIASASLSRRWESWLNTGVGLSIFEGPDPDEGDLSLGGLYDHNDQVTLEVSGVF
ncbi:MAG: hypothetical protein ACOCV2_11535, partial [Persicimonas sp.]